MSRLMIVEVPSYSCEFRGIREVAELIRCKECKWAKANGTYQWCGRLDSTARITADDFCSYGEREGE